MKEMRKASKTTNPFLVGARLCMPCVENFCKSLEVCMTDEEKEISEKALIMAKAIIDFFGNKELLELNIIFSGRSDECIFGKLEGCLNATIMKYNDENERVMIHNVHKLLTQEEGCTNLVGFKNCVLDTVSECENKPRVELLMDTFEQVLQTIIDQTPCKSVIE